MGNIKVQTRSQESMSDHKIERYLPAIFYATTHVDRGNIEVETMKSRLAPTHQQIEAHASLSVLFVFIVATHFQ